MYELSLREGIVCRIVGEDPGRVLLEVSLDGEGAERAVCYPALTGIPAAGDRVLLNTTAVDLGLGTGGYHFVTAVIARGGRINKREGDARRGGGLRRGHIMKMRYTPFQVRTLSVEEEASPYHQIFEEFRTLRGYPVVIIPLHSLLAPLVINYRAYFPVKRVVYLMTEGGSLALGFSNELRELKERGYIDTTITFGQAFGGDLEAVNIFTALIAAREAAGGDLIVVGMGPGNVGTGSSLGFSGADISLICHAVRLLEGRNILVPRLSFAERRPRHYGLSHHTITLLKRLLKEPVDLVLPDEGNVRNLVRKSGIAAGHNLFFYPVEETAELLVKSGFSFSSMGRGFNDDPLFFITAGLAVYRLMEIMSLSPDQSRPDR